MNGTFQAWLFDQKQRQDSVGKLARAMAELDYSYVPARRRPDEHKRWADIVTRYGKLEHVLAFNQAWLEYQSLNEDNSKE